MPQIGGRKILRADTPVLLAMLVKERDAYKREVVWLQEQVEQVRADLRELQAVVLARHGVVKELAGLYRERQIVLARAAQRDPAIPLQ
jgi:hypothetical protein